MGWSLARDCADQPLLIAIVADGSPCRIDACGQRRFRYGPPAPFDRTPDGAVKGIIRYDIYLDGYFVGSRRNSVVCGPCSFLQSIWPPSSVILIGTGSEVALCVEAYQSLTREGIAARVISMPSWELFEQQDQAYRDSVLPPEVTARVSVEQGSVIGWDHYVGMNGAKIGMHTFGSSAPIKDLLTKFGFTPDKVVSTAKEQIAQSRRQNS